MAHIASCVANAEHASPRQSPSQASSSDKPHAWRMLPSDQQRRYQLFPKDKQLPLSSSGKALDPEKAFAYAMGDKTDKANAVAHLRLRPNQHSQARRRKPIPQDSSHMTTVQEVPMDSPTIPGRPALHERSSSAPKEKTGPVPTPISKDRDHHGFASTLDRAFTGTAEPAWSPPSLLPDSPAPLIIHQRNRPAPLLQSKISLAKLRSDSAPPRESPRVSTPDLSLPRSATTDGTSGTALTTPMSAPLTELHCASPKSWDGPGSGDGFATPYTDDASPYGAACGHQRRVSASSSIVDRGRPRKRDGQPSSNICRDKDKNSPLPAPPKCSEGWKPRDALGKLSAGDSSSLQKQAYRQAERFEVLGAGDVEALSKELRQLDERTEYLRRTYTSLRSGRRNLHSRICQYLRSPRTTRFSHESMLRQEEALAELDDSIDDWVNKLEHVENRRARIRQKLLEHVAAATLLPVPSSPAASCESLQQIMGVRSPVPSGISTPPRSPKRQAFSNPLGGESPSPQRVVAQVPSTVIEQPVVEIEQAAQQTRGSVAKGPKRSDVESIRVYVGGDVFALLADVEDEISRMGSQRIPAKPWESSGRQGERGKHGSSKGSATPNGSASSFVFPPPRTPASHTSTTKDGPKETMPSVPPPPPLKDIKPAEGELLLTSAVFKP
ncbi:up-regulated during septation domain-containing protein [Hirsutella rhossiliensis]|uniref:Up-regulated during septation domain-containing protein n=1 Tax=Hirsutella rhossiliensis TaxID=111463 RepID=A0A9P8N0M5_9HYPO|nr:up-regulated during septation domain-containing protein [Hirsutella rhossiliensis]KAH0963761.1 up-regulated during septation domain-containing protein [Hirsutella rhossiliensis]